MTEIRRKIRMTDDERAIRDLVATWMEASQAGDTATVLSLMADDVIFQVPGREPFGKAAFAAMSQGMKGVRMEGSSDIRELRVLGDWAYLRNSHRHHGDAARRQADAARRHHAHHPAQGSERPMAAGARCQSADGGEGRRLADYAMSTPRNPALAIARVTVPSALACPANSLTYESRAASPFFTASAMTLRP